MTRWLETDSLSNQDISSALAIGAYTADADRMILVQFFADQVAGNGDYEFYVTLRVNGAGSSYRLIPITTAAAASGLTAIGGQSGMIAVRAGDVVTVYLDGLAGDNSTPDTTVRWFEMAALRPTIADRTLDVSAGGEAGVDWGNVGSPTTTVNLSGTSTKANETAPLDAAGTRDALGMAAADLDTQLDAILEGAGSSLTAQQTRDAMKLAPTAGAPAAGSVDAHLDAIQAQTDTIDDIKAVTDALDVSAVTQVAASAAGHLTITVARTFDEGVTGLTIPADWETALWTLKNNARDADTAALVQLRATNPEAGTDGLQRLNGAALVAPITAADGELTVTQATGRIDVWLSDEMTALLGAATSIGWDVKFIDASGDSSGQRGTADVVLTETKATA